MKGRRAVSLAGTAIVIWLLALPSILSAAGPPYPDPVEGQVVYDFADVLAPATEVEATDTIEGIEARTGAEVVVYTQVKPSSDTPAKAEEDAIALMDQWGIGRAASMTAS